MATLKVPSFATGNFSEAGKTAARSIMEAGYLRFKDEIDKAVRLTHVPREILLPFMYVETGGKMLNVRNKHTSATGLMQLMPNSVADFLCVNKKRISPELKAVLVSHLGEKRVNGALIPGMDGTTAMNRYGKYTREDLDNPEVNILLGALALRYYIDGNTHNGVIDMERVVIKYNRGMNTKVVGNSPATVLAYCRLRYGSEVTNYIISMTGKNGLLSAFA